MLEKKIANGTVFLAGLIHEQNSMDQIFSAGDPLVFNLAMVRGINSLGCNGFMRFIAKLRDAEIALHECPTCFIDAVNMMPTLVGTPPKIDRIKSFFIPYFCASCGEEFDSLIQMSKVQNQTNPTLEPAPCPKCKTECSPVAGPEEFLFFLQTDG